MGLIQEGLPFSSCNFDSVFSRKVVIKTLYVKYAQGSYAESKDSICQPCGPGTVQPDAAKTSCNLCPVGQVPDSERTKCLPCGEVSGQDVEQFVALIHAGTLSNFDLYVLIGVSIIDKDKK